MGVVSLNAFRTEPGRLADHLAAATEAVGHLRRLGLQALNLQCLAGADVGTIATVVNHADNAAYASAMQTVLADADWQEFYARVSAEGAAMPVETTLMQDLDPGFQPSPDRPMGVVMAVQWRTRPGRMGDFMAAVEEGTPHVERLGGAPRVMQSLVGAHPMTTMYSTTFADMAAYGAYSDAVATDEQFQSFWFKVMTDPPAEAIRSGLYMNISD